MSDSEPVKKTPYMTKVYFLLAALCMLLPSAMKAYPSETQRLVVSSGKLSDPNFTNTVIYMFQHSLEGATGVVINRPLTPEQEKQIPTYLQKRNIPYYWGGPVDFPSLVVVIERKKIGPDGVVEMRTRKFDDAIKEDPGYLDKIEESLRAGKNDYRVYVGASGWGFLQLGMEFGKGVWASTELNHELVFYEGIKPYEVWTRALTKANTKRKLRSPGTI